MIQVAIPTNRNVVDFRLAGWLYGLKAEDFGGKKPELIFNHQQPVDANRNKIVYNFLNNTEHDWLLFLDDDMIPHKGFDVKKLINSGKKVVSGLTVVMAKGVPSPLIMKKLEGNDEVRYRTFNVSDLEEDGTSLVEVDGVGTGCLLIHRDVLEAIKPPWFRFQFTENGELKLSEDYTFSNKVREAGFKMFIDCEAIVGHAKNVDLYDLNKLLAKVVQKGAVSVETMDPKNPKKEIFKMKKGKTDLVVNDKLSEKVFKTKSEG